MSEEANDAFHRRSHLPAVVVEPADLRDAAHAVVVAAGMAPAAALRAATSGAATILGWPKAGIVAPGYWSDAVLVDGDPLADVGILANRARVHAVIKGGVLEVDRRPES